MRVSIVMCVGGFCGVCNAEHVSIIMCVCFQVCVMLSILLVGVCGEVTCEGLAMLSANVSRKATSDDIINTRPPMAVADVLSHRFMCMHT